MSALWDAITCICICSDPPTTTFNGEFVQLCSHVWYLAGGSDTEDFVSLVKKLFKRPMPSEAFPQGAETCCCFGLGFTPDSQTRRLLWSRRRSTPLLGVEIVTNSDRLVRRILRQISSSRAQFARDNDISESTAKRWEDMGYIPRSLRIGRKRVYHLPTLEAHLERRAAAASGVSKARAMRTIAVPGQSLLLIEKVWGALVPIGQRLVMIPHRTRWAARPGLRDPNWFADPEFAFLVQASEAGRADLEQLGLQKLCMPNFQAERGIQTSRARLQRAVRGHSVRCARGARMAPSGQLAPPPSRRSDSRRVALTS